MPSIPLRPRRLRRTAAIRDLVRETHLRVENLAWPLFVKESGEAEPIKSLPGQFRWPLAEIPRVCAEAWTLGIRLVALFPVLDSSLKTSGGDEALNPETLVLRAVRAVKAAVPSLTLMCDVALDPYTSHGHDGVLTADGLDVDNDITVPILAQMAVLNARAGADFVAPSDMMDGRITAIRSALDAEGFTNTGIISYSAKFNSAFYGPFREAVGSAQAAGTRLLSKATYQMDPANRREARRETGLDETEGADMLMVKPAGAYLDIVADLRARTELPVVAYQVSGEYAQLHAASQLGWLDLRRSRDETLLAIKRAGADIILTYFAADVARDLRQT